ncbi:MAG: GNAT family N-acetyltransferase [Nitrospiraceae bacterium]
MAEQRIHNRTRPRWFLNTPLLRWLDSGFVCTQARISDIPPLPDQPSPVVREMDMQDADDIRLWLEIHNDAFHPPWNRKEYDYVILNHPTKLITTTYFIMENGSPIGAASVGVYRRNPEVGVGHYLGFKKDARNRGLGKWMTLFRYHQLRPRGIFLCESETRMSHERSILIHFDCGFRPKLALDYWNTPQSESAALRFLTSHRLTRLYRRWKRHRIKP